ncbi:Hsp20/alpha crystallin family protein [Daejeonella sp.]|uniref:Hsp20/alpha crystallin family protein n=1 Tax=Daejeonella sp. TaxID=2805397 RepID=UPI0025C06592|nr:Hsp20/alpha crystallin family protein [Daejeonella sp.]
MKTDTLARVSGGIPSVFDDLLKPWNDWFEGRELWSRATSLPPVNIMEQENQYLVTLAAPGMKREDFKIDLSGNMLNISNETEEEKEETEKTFTRKEYNYRGFSRSFSLPEGIDTEKIEAKYEDGILKITLPRTEESKMKVGKSIPIQ